MCPKYTPDVIQNEIDVIRCRAFKVNPNLCAAQPTVMKRSKLFCTDIGLGCGRSVGWSQLVVIGTSLLISTDNQGFFLYEFISGYEIQFHFIFMRSSTYTYLIGKFIVQVDQTSFRGFADTCAVLTHQHDFLVEPVLIYLLNRL